jgi:hypothetical protein
MERKINPDIHIICGKCGCATMFEFKLTLDGTCVDDIIYPAVFLTCNNCGTLTGLDGIVEDKTDWQKLGLTIKLE